MRAHRLAVGLGVINLVLMALLLGRGHPFTAQAARQSTQEAAPLLRGRALELVDERGQVRSRLNVEQDGEVVFRLLDRNGTIRVKLGGNEGGSGLVLLDEATEPAVHIIARQAANSRRPTTTSLSLRGADGKQRVIRP